MATIITKDGKAQKVSEYGGLPEFRYTSVGFEYGKLTIYPIYQYEISGKNTYCLLIDGKIGKSCKDPISAVKSGMIAAGWSYQKQEEILYLIRHKKIDLTNKR